MRIVVNDIAASVGGALTILESFHRYVRDFDQDNEWVFLLGSDLLDDSAHIRSVVLPDVKSSWLRRFVFDLISGRRLIAPLKPDVVFSLQNTYTYGLRCPQVVYVHQPLPFQQSKNFSLWRRQERPWAIYQHVIGAIIKQSIRRADHVFVQTEWMREAIREQVGIANDRVESVLPDLDDLSAYKFEGTLDAGAFFYPTASAPYKNNDCIFAACRFLREQGVVDFKVTMTIEATSAEPNVIPIGRVPREQVLETLSRSTLIFPSLIETYGLPLAEARALGAVVLAADLPYAREVLDGYENAYYFDPASPNQLAGLMRTVITGTIVRFRAAHDAEVPGLDAGIIAWGKVIKILNELATTAEEGEPA
jgi:glycosyltransferase involved in cell wall biosynthesis